jgi:hypothetical protein
MANWVHTQFCSKQENEPKSLEFFIPKRKIYRNDVLEIQQKILSMTSDQREKLGINKSTLWYIKKNISEGKTSKIYSKF